MELELVFVQGQPLQVFLGVFQRQIRQETHLLQASDFPIDLTQTTLGLSRDDAGSFLGEYIEQAIIERDPFVSLDTEGVGVLMKLAVERGRLTRKDLKLGICGEHGGDPDTIHFCESIGLDYVSCSPYRVPIARLAAAQSTLRESFEKD